MLAVVPEKEFLLETAEKEFLLETAVSSLCSSTLLKKKHFRLIAIGVNVPVILNGHHNISGKDEE